MAAGRGRGRGAGAIKIFWFPEYDYSSVASAATSRRDQGVELEGMSDAGGAGGGGGAGALAEVFADPRKAIYVPYHHGSDYKFFIDGRTNLALAQLRAEKFWAAVSASFNEDGVAKEFYYSLLASEGERGLLMCLVEYFTFSVQSSKSECGRGVFTFNRMREKPGDGLSEYKPFPDGRDSLSDQDLRSLIKLLLKGKVEISERMISKMKLRVSHNDQFRGEDGKAMWSGFSFVVPLNLFMQSKLWEFILAKAPGDFTVPEPLPASPSRSVSSIFGSSASSGSDAAASDGSDVEAVVDKRRHFTFEESGKAVAFWTKVKEVIERFGAEFSDPDSGIIASIYGSMNVSLEYSEDFTCSTFKLVKRAEGEVDESNVRAYIRCFFRRSLLGGGAAGRSEAEVSESIEIKNIVDDGELLGFEFNVPLNIVMGSYLLEFAKQKMPDIESVLPVRLGCGMRDAGCRGGVASRRLY